MLEKITETCYNKTLFVDFHGQSTDLRHPAFGHTNEQGAHMETPLPILAALAIMAVFGVVYVTRGVINIMHGRRKTPRLTLHSWLHGSFIMGMVMRYQEKTMLAQLEPEARADYYSKQRLPDAVLNDLTDDDARRIGQHMHLGRLSGLIEAARRRNPEVMDQFSDKGTADQH